MQKTNSTDPADITTYSWDLRDRLTGIQGPDVSATFAYDALGRRIERMVNGEMTRYVYDGVQAIAETRGSQTTTLLTGLQIDEMIARYTDQGQRTYLTDALGSVIGQAREDQSIQNWYSYSPYGEVAATADDEGNDIEYTGRENDGTGLYYYRARYYDAVLKRFVSEDPIALDGGVNTYVYVAGNPVSFIDPNGLATLSVGGRGSFFFGGAGGTVGGSIGFSTCGQVCIQIQTCARLGGGASIGAAVTASGGTGNFTPGNSLGAGVFSSLGAGPFGGVSTNTTANNTSVTVSGGGGGGVSAGVQSCITRTICLLNPGN